MFQPNIFQCKQKAQVVCQVWKEDFRYQFVFRASRTCKQLGDAFDYILGALASTLPPQISLVYFEIPEMKHGENFLRHN